MVYELEGSQGSRICRYARKLKHLPTSAIEQKCVRKKPLLFHIQKIIGGRKEKGILQRRGVWRTCRADARRGGAVLRITTHTERTERYKATTRSARAKHADQSLRDPYKFRASVMIRPHKETLSTPRHPLAPRTGVCVWAKSVFVLYAKTNSERTGAPNRAVLSLF